MSSWSLSAWDLHHLQALEDFNSRMTALRKEIAGWIRYYSQLDDVVCELQEDENGYFSENE